MESDERKFWKKEILSMLMYGITIYEIALFISECSASVSKSEKDLSKSQKNVCVRLKYFRVKDRGLNQKGNMGDPAWFHKHRYSRKWNDHSQRNVPVVLATFMRIEFHEDPWVALLIRQEYRLTVSIWMERYDNAIENRPMVNIGSEQNLYGWCSEWTVRTERRTSFNQWPSDRE